jgi:hypothetical protein
MNKNYNIYDVIFDALYFKNNKIEFSITNFIKTIFVVPAFIEIFLKTREKLLQKFKKLKEIKLNFKESETKIITENTKNTRRISTESHETNAPPTAPPIILEAQNG